MLEWEGWLARSTSPNVTPNGYRKSRFMLKIAVTDLWYPK